MIKDNENITKTISLDEIGTSLSDGSIGIEKECLRVNKSSIAQTDHFHALGSSLCNKFITTDFSESLLEFVTPPVNDKDQALDFLDNIHHFVTQKIEDEYLWPLSMPPLINSASDINIAKYGTSNEALFKMTYRSGLSGRYGRLMQAIAGIHFNYSLPQTFWEKIQYFFPEMNEKDITSKIYFRTLRNIQRMNWLILYLFGASPIVSKNFVNTNSKDKFIKFKDYYYLPYATSLRMSDLGYQNFNQSNLNISLDSLDKYTDDLNIATSTKLLVTQQIKDLQSHFSQINSNTLQIEDEYYAVARPKSNVVSNERPISKLINHGVDYIELRSIDLNPFSSKGIEIDTIEFLEVFLIYCTLKSSPALSKDELKESKHNDLLVAKNGRKESLILRRNKKNISLKDWGNEIFDEMFSFISILGNKGSLLNRYKRCIQYPELTISESFLNRVLEDNVNFNTIGYKIAKKNKKKYLNLHPSKNIYWEILQEEVDRSINRQSRLEADDNKSFEEYVKSYFSY